MNHPVPRWRRIIGAWIDLFSAIVSIITFAEVWPRWSMDDRVNQMKHYVFNKKKEE